MYTMEVNSSSGRIEKVQWKVKYHFFEGVQGSFLNLVCELELKYGANYIKVFTFKQLTHYVHYEALDIYEQHFPRILGVTQIPNPTYAIAIATASQATLQPAITHHGTMPNSPDLVPTSINISLQRLIDTTTNSPPTINALAFADLVGEFFQVLELEFPVNKF
jgi:hypothetical protein